MKYVDYQFDDTEAFVETFDEAPLWSAAFGLLLLKHLELKPDLMILDIGSGTGFPLLEIAARCGPSCKIYGIDPWVNANNRANKKIRNYGLSNVEIIEGYAEEMPFAENYFDLITSNLGINNFSHLAAVIKESYRVLKPAGKIALTTNTNGHWKGFYRIFKEVLFKTGNNDIIPKLKDEQKHRSNLSAISNLLTTNGFQINSSHKETLEMKFVDGIAFLNHYFIKLGWLQAWKGLLPDKKVHNVFQLLEDTLNKEAIRNNGLCFETPMLFIQADKPS